MVVAVEVGEQRLDQRSAVIGFEADDRVGLLLGDREDRSSGAAVRPEHRTQRMRKALVETALAHADDGLALGCGHVDRMTGNTALDPHSQRCREIGGGGLAVDEPRLGAASGQLHRVQRDRLVRAREEEVVAVPGCRGVGERPAGPHVRHPADGPRLVEPLGGDLSQFADYSHMGGIVEPRERHRQQPVLRKGGPPLVPLRRRRRRGRIQPADPGAEGGMQGFEGQGHGIQPATDPLKAARVACRCCPGSGRGAGQWRTR